MDLVLDCSMALAWAIPDEGSEAADRLLSGLERGSRLWIPALWWYELSNALTVAQRRGRLSDSDLLRLIELYRTLPLFTDTLLGAEAVFRFRVLAQRYKLSAYDAAYLELAQRRGLGLMTLDGGLAKAARGAGIPLPRT
ncbi:MAG: type II toxin-antitoxin system VapC family toxin [Deltaproteobacteria bacterium]|nr:type II toxin-antitoxin system VapC family toxin [Deltaproteobacteria bacterium]